MKRFIFLLAAATVASQIALAKSSGSLPEQKQVTAEARYDLEETAVKDAKIKLNHACFSELKGERLVYVSSVTTVLPPTQTNSGFGHSYDVKMTGLCILK